MKHSLAARWNCRAARTRSRRRRRSGIAVRPCPRDQLRQPQPDPEEARLGRARADRSDAASSAKGDAQRRRRDTLRQPDRRGRRSATRPTTNARRTTSRRPRDGGGGGGNDPNYTPSGQSGCSEKLRRQRQGQPELPERRPIRLSPGAARPRTRRRSRSTRRTRITWSRARTTTAAATATATAPTRSTAASTGTTRTVPMSFIDGDATWGTPRQYWQAGGDTSVAWDTKGNAYFSCQVFNRGAVRLTQPGPVERVLRLPLDRQRRRLVELPRPAGHRAQRHRRRGDRAPRQELS